MACKRNNICVLAFILSLVLLYGTPTKAEVNLVELVKKIQPAVVTVITYGKEKNLLGQASGFFIDKKGLLITNYHVLEGAYSAEIKTYDGKKYPVEQVAAESKEADIIEVSVDIPENAVKSMHVVEAIPEVGERVVVIGSPLGLEQTVSEGIVSAVRDMPAIGKIFQISAPISPGSSGSPVLNMKGEVIGVATFQVIEGQNLNFAVSGEQVLALKPEGKGKTLKEWTSHIFEERSKGIEELLQKAVIYLWVGEYEKALDCFKKTLDYFEKASEKNSRFVEAWYWTAYCYRMLGRNQDAIETFKEVIRIDPGYENAWNDLGVTYGELGRHHEAMEALKQAILINPDLAEAHANMGNVYVKLGRRLEAIEAYKQAIHIKSDLAGFHRNLGATYGELGLYEKATEAYKQAIRINPDCAEAHEKLGIAYFELGRHQEAIEAYKEAIRIEPDYVAAHCALGAINGILGRRQEAIEALKQAIRIEPDYPDAHYLLGLAYAELGRYEEAIEAWKQVIRIKPDYAQAHFVLGSYYVLLGNKSSALDEYKILKTLDKNLANQLFNLIYE